MKQANYKKTVLDNGIRIITESIPGRTVSVGIWVNVGSRDEDPSNNGCAHFIEHMLFKGTTVRDALQIAKELDALGGASNAFTSRETTCLYATVLDSQLPELLSIYSDLFLNSIFSSDEVSRETSVILQEMDMVEDTPEDLVHDLYGELIWNEHPLSNTVLGRKDVVESMTPHMIEEYRTRFYTPDHIVVAASGNIDHDYFVEILAKKFSFGHLGEGRQKRENSRVPPGKGVPRSLVVTRPLEQNHVVMGTRGLSSVHPDRYALVVLNILLGGNMSSRLFQEIRENKGLAYTIYSFSDSNSDSGHLGVYTAVSPNTVNETMQLIATILRDLTSHTIDEKELELAKGYARASIFLAAENMDARMMRMVRNEIIFGSYVSLQEVDKSLAAVDCGVVNDLAASLFSGPLSSLVLGPSRANQVQWPE